MTRKLALAASLLAFASCSTVHQDRFPHYNEPSVGHNSQLVQGLIGATLINDVELELDPGDLLESDDTGTAPMFGGVFMIPLRGDEKRQVGFEVGFTTSFRGDVDLIAAGGGGAIVVIDNDVFLLDTFAGVYFNQFFRGGFRFYAGAGPLLNYGEVDVEYEQSGSLIDAHETAFGTGLYARTGLEIEVRPGMFAGFGVRWVDAHLDLSGDLSDLDYEALQYAVTITTGY